MGQGSTKYEPTDRERLIDAECKAKTGRALWQLVGETQRSAPAWGWDKIAAEVYRRSGASVSGQALRKWDRARRAGSAAKAKAAAKA